MCQLIMKDKKIVTYGSSTPSQSSYERLIFDKRNQQARCKVLFTAAKEVSIQWNDSNSKVFSCEWDVRKPERFLQSDTLAI